jgi:hypothetical protein
MKTPERLKIARGTLSQAAAAAKLDIPLRTWEDWERGARNPPEYLVALIEKALAAADHKAGRAAEGEKHRPPLQRDFGGVHQPRAYTLGLPRGSAASKLAPAHEPGR